MTLDTTAAPGAAASTDAPAQPANEPSLATSTETPPGETHEPDPEAERKRESQNVQRRINTLTRDRSAARGEAQFWRTRASELEAQTRQPVEGEQPQGTKEKQPNRDIEREVQTRAEALAASAEATRNANRIFSEGVKSFGEEAFRECVSVLQDEAGPLYRQDGTPTPLGEAIHDAEKPAALLQHLGQHPEVAESLKGLTAAQLGRRIARIEADISAEPKRSGAPAPLKPPAGSKGGGGVPDAKSDDFLAHKLKQLRGR